MNFELSSTRPRVIDADTLIVGLYDDKMLTSACAELDEQSSGAIKRLLESGDLSGKLGSTTLLFQLPGVAAARVLVVGLGEQRKFDAVRWSKVQREASARLKGTPAKRVASYLIELEVPGKDLDWKIKRAVLIADYVGYRYTATLKAAVNGSGGGAVETLLLVSPQERSAALKTATALAGGVTVARELGNLPPNICNPAYLAQQALDLAARAPHISVEVLEREQMEALGMGALLAVARGSANAPKLIAMRYRGAADDSAPYVFVGKGITFDTGGTNIKPSPGMEEMKFDMCGAAAVFGLMEAVARLQPAINVIGIAVGVENMPGADAYRPSDVLTTMAGHTVEVLNTDAEGRLILCDALTWAQRQFKPHTLIDIATLTGACVVALGTHASGLMSHDDALAAELLAAGEATQDRAWRLPLWDEYQSQLETGFADFANIGGKNGGAITAGCFLSRFTEGTRWAHLDIAGSAWDSGRKGTATGRPVSLLGEWLLQQKA
jgi:leucyl aminopeptidase